MSEGGSAVQWTERFRTEEDCKARKEERIQIHQTRGLKGWTQEMSACEPRLLNTW